MTKTKGKHIAIGGVTISVATAGAIALWILRGGVVLEQVRDHERFIEETAKPAIEKFVVLEATVRTELMGISKQNDRMQVQLDRIEGAIIKRNN